MGFLDFIIKPKKDNKEITVPYQEEGGMQSLQYGIFKQEEQEVKIPTTLYEKAAKISEKFIPLNPDEKTRMSVQEAIDFAHLKITPKGSTSFAVLVTLVLGFIILFGVLLGVNLLLALIFMMLDVAVFYYFYTYPLRLRKIYELNAGSEIVMLILHMVIYMRNFPNLEGAVKFASQNLTGPLALDVKKMLWDVHVGTYSSMEQALLSYSQNWKSSFKAFADSVNAIIYSLYTGGDRRMELLDESIEIILTSLNERSNVYVQKLKSPVTLVNALGILLPTMTLTMLPIATIFLGDELPPELIFGFYNILLPILLAFIIKNILDDRVITLPEADISLHPGLPPENTFSFGNFFISAYIPSILVAIPFAYYGYINWESLTLNESYILTFGMFLSIALFFFFNSFQKLSIRKDIIGMESEFREVLFGLGQEVDRGIPLEVAIEKISPTLRGNYAMKLISTITTNIRYKGLTFENSIFDSKEGAILYFPSKLIHSILKAVVDAGNKGTHIASQIMISIASYLKDMHKTQMSIQDKFSEIIGSMQMQARILLPLICGVMNTLTYMIIEMIAFLSNSFTGIPVEGAAASYATLLNMWQGVSISPAAFQLSIGIYALQTIVLLSWFMNGIEVGVDKISLYDTIAKNLIIGGIVYLAVSIISLMMFSPFLDMVKISMAL